MKITQGVAELLISRMRSQKVVEEDSCLLGLQGNILTPGFLVEGLPHHCNLFLCLEWECYLLDPNCLLKGLPLDV